MLKKLFLVFFIICFYLGTAGSMLYADDFDSESGEDCMVTSDQFVQVGNFFDITTFIDTREKQFTVKGDSFFHFDTGYIQDNNLPKIIGVEKENGILTITARDSGALHRIEVILNKDEFYSEEVVGKQKATITCVIEEKGIHELEIVAYNEAGKASESWVTIYDNGRPTYEPGESSGFGWDMWKN